MSLVKNYKGMNRSRPSGTTVHKVTCYICKIDGHNSCECLGRSVVSATLRGGHAAKNCQDASAPAPASATAPAPASAAASAATSGGEAEDSSNVVFDATLRIALWWGHMERKVGEVALPYLCLV